MARAPDDRTIELPGQDQPERHLPLALDLVRAMLGDETGGLACREPS
jgi:hypothetical protein